MGLFFLVRHLRVKQGRGGPAVQEANGDPEAVIRSIELMAILLSNTPLNRARGKFPGSRKVWQRDTIHQKAGITLEQRVSKLTADLAELEGALCLPEVGRRAVSLDCGSCCLRVGDLRLGCP